MDDVMVSSNMDSWEMKVTASFLWTVELEDAKHLASLDLEQWRWVWSQDGVKRS
jgi:hypothetical protein